MAYGGTRGRRRVVVFGPPGAGKGTQCARLSARLGIEHISTGELLRAEVTAGTALGRRVGELMNRGELIPDETIFELILPRVRAASAAGGYLLDGYPRSVAQAHLTRQGDGAGIDIAPDAAVYLDVGRDELVRRLLARAEGRSDDNAATIHHRLRVFDEATRPLVDLYRAQGLLHVIDAGGDEAAVEAAILAALDD